MKKLLYKIKDLLQIKQQLKITEKITFLEEKIINLEKTNLIILTKLLQTNNVSQITQKRDSKSEITIVARKDLNEGKTPTYH